MMANPVPGVKAKKWPSDEEVQKRLGAHLKALRLDAGVSQGDVAEGLEVVRTLAGKLERGTGWRVIHILRAAAFFNVTPAEFFAAAFDDVPPARGGVELSDVEAGLIYTLRARGPVAAMQLLLDDLK